MATRRGPLDLPLGQTLSGQQVAPPRPAPDTVANLLNAAQRPQAAPPLPERQAEVLADLRETQAEARRSANLADMQRQLAQEAEEHRQRTLRTARAREEQRRAEATRAREAARVAQEQEQARRETRQRVEAEMAALRGARTTNRTEALDATPEREHHLLALAGVIQRTIDSMQRQLTDLNQDLAVIREKFQQKTPAPSGYDEAPFHEGERHLDLGEPE